LELRAPQLKGTFLTQSVFERYAGKGRHGCIIVENDRGVEWKIEAE
jgi:hypothetical protein